MFAVRDLFKPPAKILYEAGLAPGYHVLDYGCGSGSYTVATAAIVGDAGRVYALDVNPKAVQSVKKRMERKQLSNYETILSDCATGLDDESVDMVLLYDVFHIFNEPETILRELHRVMKPDARLSFSDHHMVEEDILFSLTDSECFDLFEKKSKMYTFLKKA